jgi:hypothetical protein
MNVRNIFDFVWSNGFNIISHDLYVYIHVRTNNMGRKILRKTYRLTNNCQK